MVAVVEALALTSQHQPLVLHLDQVVVAVLVAHLFQAQAERLVRGLLVVLIMLLLRIMVLAVVVVLVQSAVPVEVPT
jgi:hypothetical protein